MTPPPTIPLVCPTCARADFADLRALKSHEATHRLVPCPRCGAEMAPQGLGPHKRHCGATDLAARRMERIIDQLEGMLEAGLGPDAIDRCSRFLRSVTEPAPSARLVVIGPTFGPHLTTLANAGGVIMSAKEPVIVVDLALVVEPAVEKPASVTGRGW